MKFISHNKSGTDLAEVLQSIFDSGVPPGHIIGITVKGNLFHIGYWTMV